MLQPKRTKYRKYQKGRIAKIGGISSNTSSLSFGQFGIKSLKSGRLSAQVIEAARRTMTRKLRRHGKIWIRVFPDIPVTEKPAEVRMGKGKGNIAYWVCRIKAGQILFELDGMSMDMAKQASFLAAQKIPFPTEFIEIS
jgi:large subunit ribosomal protein L16